MLPSEVSLQDSTRPHFAHYNSLTSPLKNGGTRPAWLLSTQSTNVCGASLTTIHDKGEPKLLSNWSCIYSKDGNEFQIQNYRILTKTIKWISLNSKYVVFYFILCCLCCVLSSWIHILLCISKYIRNVVIVVCILWLCSSVQYAGHLLHVPTSWGGSLDQTEDRGGHKLPILKPPKELWFVPVSEFLPSFLQKKTYFYDVST